MAGTVLGVVILSRHGDRSGRPTGYAPTATTLTPLGENQQYLLGQALRDRYLNESSPNYLRTINSGAFSESQVHIRGDAGGEGTVILDSASALSQGLYPPYPASTQTLANGTTITSPLGGWQYVSVESVNPEGSISLEGWTQCNTFNASNFELYKSEAFNQVAADNAAFMESLVPLVGGRNVTLANFYNVFDYINVQSIHNATFLASVDQQLLNQTRALANYHEYSVFTSPQLGAIQNIAGQTILPEILSALTTFTNASNPLKMVEMSISYKPFLSLFNMMGVSDTYPELRGLVNYASAITFELRQGTTDDSPTVALSFKNGTDADFVDYNMFGQDATTLVEFNSTLSPYAITDLPTWCRVCDNTADRGCDLVSQAEKQYGEASVAPGQVVSPLAAGFIGAGITLAVAVATVALLVALGCVGFGRRTRAPKEKEMVEGKGYY